jgi:predicted dehydrogenase
VKAAPLQVGIVGAGRIGFKRAQEAARCEQTRVAAVADVDGVRARELADQFGATAHDSWESLVSNTDLDIVVVATTHNSLAPVSLVALRSGKHVLCEKPLALNAREAREVVDEAARRGRILKTGFNHRHHPAVHEAFCLAQSGAIGRLMHIRCRYGHGGRAGYDREWRADPAISGGGELQDQGAHALDLFRWFLGEFSEIHAFLSTSFWDMPVEDNAFCTLRTRAGQVATLHASWTQWKNLFSFEVFGDMGYLLVDGLGGNYGTERLTIGRRPPEFGRPEEQVREYTGADQSWTEEWNEFISAIREQRRPLADGEDGWHVLKLIEAANESSRARRVVFLE